MPSLCSSGLYTLIIKAKWAISKKAQRITDRRELEIIWPKHVLDRRVKTIPSRAHPNSGASELAKDGPRSGGQVPVTGGPSVARVALWARGEGALEMPG